MSKLIKFIDLFAGIGGMRIGMESALNDLKIKHKCVFSSEINKNASYTYNLNFNEYPKGDIYKFSKNIPNFDFLLGGFPCQPFSYAGKKKGFGDTRGTLFFEIEKIISKYKPKGFILENVRGIISHDKGRTVNTIINKLSKLGYKVEYKICNSANYNLPQNRVRVFFIGILGKKIKSNIISDFGPSDTYDLGGNNNQLNLFYDYKKFKTLKSILENQPSKKYDCSKDFIKKLDNHLSNRSLLHGKRLIDYRGGNSIHSWELGIKGKCSKEEINFMNQLISNRRKKVYGEHQDGKMLTKKQIKNFYKKNNLEKLLNSLLKKGYIKKVQNKYNPICGNMSFEVFKFLDPDKISTTLTASDTNRLGVFYKNRIRRITPREAARIQGFPNNFILNPNDNLAYSQLGNAVSVPVVRCIVADLFKNNNL